MLTYCVRNFMSRHLSIFKPPQYSVAACLHNTRNHCSAPSAEESDQVRTLMQLCVDRYYISPGQSNVELFQRGASCGYGPLGMQLRRNILELWWHSVTTSSAQVFGINTLSSTEDPATDGQGQLKAVDSESFQHIFEQQKVSREQLIQKVQELLQKSPSVRRNHFKGRVQYVPDKYHRSIRLI